MPNRILRDWTDSDRVDGLTAEAERFFVRLIMKADDFGRYTAEPKRLKAFLFPLKDSLRETDLCRWLAECEQAALVRCYAVAGKRYLEIADFRQRLRQMREIYPRPTEAAERPADDGQPTAVRPPNRSESEGKGNELGGAGDPGVFKLLETALNTEYGRTAETAWTYAEQSQLAEIARRPGVLAELKEIVALRKRMPAAERRYFPNSLGSLLAKWTDVLDKARVSRPRPLVSTPPPPVEGRPLTDEQRREMAGMLRQFRQGDRAGCPPM